MDRKVEGQALGVDLKVEGKHLKWIKGHARDKLREVTRKKGASFKSGLESKGDMLSKLTSKKKKRSFGISAYTFCISSLIFFDALKVFCFHAIQFK